MGFHRKNHFIPQFYLQYWASNNSIYIHRNLVSNKNVPEWESKYVKGVGFYSDLYTDYIEGSESDEVERWLDREFESPAKPILDKVSKGELLSKEDYSVLTKYVFSQLVRTPKFIKNNQGKWRQILKDSLNDVSNRLSKADISLLESERIDEFDGNVHLPIKTEVVGDIDANTSRLKINTHIGRGVWLSGIKHLLTRTINILPDYKWSIYQAPLNFNWPTSDNPVTLLNYYSEHNYDFKGGMGKEGSEIIFPITPDHLLYTQIGKKNPKYVNPKLDLCNKLVRIICENSDEIIISKRKMPEIEGIVSRRVDKSIKDNETLEWIKEQNSLDSKFYKRRP